MCVVTSFIIFKGIFEIFVEINAVEIEQKKIN